MWKYRNSVKWSLVSVVLHWKRKRLKLQDGASVLIAVVHCKKYKETCSLPSFFPKYFAFVAHFLAGTLVG